MLAVLKPISDGTGCAEIYQMMALAVLKPINDGDTWAHSKKAFFYPKKVVKSQTAQNPKIDQCICLYNALP